MREIRYNGKTYKQVQKRTAEKLFNQGKQINLISCKADPNSPWINGFHPIDNKSYESDPNAFNRIVTSYEIYNCNSELGMYASFYIIVE